MGYLFYELLLARNISLYINTFTQTVIETVCYESCSVFVNHFGRFLIFLTISVLVIFLNEINSSVSRKLSITKILRCFLYLKTIDFTSRLLSGKRPKLFWSPIIVIALAKHTSSLLVVLSVSSKGILCLFFTSQISRIL